MAGLAACEREQGGLVVRRAERGDRAGGAHANLLGRPKGGVTREREPVRDGDGGARRGRGGGELRRRRRSRDAGQGSRVELQGIEADLHGKV